MIVSYEFLKQCQTEALLKFNSCFLLNLHAKKHIPLRKTAVTLPRCVQIFEMKHQTELTDILNSNKFKNCELKPWSAPTKSFLSIPFYGTPCRPTVSTCRYWNMYSKNFLPELLSYLFSGHKMFRSCFRAGMKKFSGTTLFESILSLFNTSQLHFCNWNLKLALLDVLSLYFSHYPFAGFGLMVLSRCFQPEIIPGVSINQSKAV